MERRTDIQYLRGLAVLFVIVFHLDASKLPNGYLGVDMFFVISGFVVTPLLQNVFLGNSNGLELKTRLKNFFIRRIYRLAPALTSTLLIFGILLFFLGPLVDQYRFISQGIATVLILGNFAAYKLDSNYFTSNPNPLIHTWSLSTEEQIYLFLPAVIYLVTRTKSANSSQISLLFRNIFLAMFIFSFLLFSNPNIEISMANLLGFELNGWGFFSPFSRIWEFILGGLCFLKYGNKPKQSRIIKTVSLVSLIILVIDKSTQSRITLTIGITITTGVFLCCRNTVLLSKMITLSLKWVGDRSYSLYLVHMPILYLISFSPLFHFSENAQYLKVALGLSLTFLTGYLSHRLIEERFRIRSLGLFDQKYSLKFLLFCSLPILALYTLMYVLNGNSLFDERKYGLTGNNSMSWDSNCSFDRFLEPCEYIFPEAKHTSLLIGDSMAGSLSSAVVQAGKKEKTNIIVFSRASCPFILETTFSSKYSPTQIDSNCVHHNREALSLAKKYKVDSIIYFQLESNSYNSAKTFGKESNSKKSLEFQVLDNLSRFRISRNRIAILGFTPHFDDGGGSRISYILGNRLSYVDTTNKSDKHWRNLISGFGYYFVDSQRLLCSQGPCIYQINNNWLLQDIHHLSFLGASVFVPSIIEFFEASHH